MEETMDTAGLAAAVSGMQDDPELLAAFAEEQAKLQNEKKKSKKGKKKKKNKQMGEQLAQLEAMMAKLDDGNDLDISAAQETLKLLEEKPKKSKKKKKEKLPAPFSAEAMIDPTADDDLNDLPPELMEELKNYEPTEAEIEAEFEILKKQEEQKRRKKEKRKKREETVRIKDEDGEVLMDEDGKEMRLDDPAILLELLEAEEDPEMKKYLKKQLKKNKKGKRKGPKKEKIDPAYSAEFDEDAFLEDDGFGWTQKDAAKKIYQPKSLRPTGDMEDPVETAEIQETEDEKNLRLAREAGEEVAPLDAPVADDDFGPTLPATGIAPRPEAGLIPGGSKLKPVLDDEIVEARLRQKALERAIQERLDKRLMRQKRIEVRLAGWIGKQRSLKKEAQHLAEERLIRAQEITEALAPEIAAQNDTEIKNRNQIVQEVREKLRKEITDEVRREIEDEENRRQRSSEKAPEAPKVPAAVMDAIQMSDAWEQFWRRYKSQLVDWKHWNEEMEEYHKQAAGWYFTQGFIQSQVSNNVPAAPGAPDEPAEAEKMDVDPTEPPPASSQVSHAPVLLTDKPPPPPTHKPEEEEDDDADGENEDEDVDEFQKKIRKKKTKYDKKMDQYEALLQDPIFDPKNSQPKMQPWGARDGEIRSTPGNVSGVTLAPDGAKFVPKATAMDMGEKAKLDRMKRMLAVVRGPELLKKATYGTNYLPTQDDALQFIKLERFRRDRHRFRSSDLDSETESSEDEDAGTSRERGARLPPWMAKSNATEVITTTTTFSTRPTTITTDVNQPGEMDNPAGEALPMSSSSESEEDEERAAKIRAMAAKFNPTTIYGDQPVEKKSDDKEDEDESFSFGFLAGKKKEENGEIAKAKQLYNREEKTPKYLPEESGIEGPGIHKEGPLKGLPKYWQQQHGLRQRPKESNKPQFVEVSVDHVPPSQRDLPDFVQDLPDELSVLDAASMAVRDYQKKQLYNQKQTKYEEYMKKRRSDTRFSIEPPKESEQPLAKPLNQNVELTEESLEFDPASFFGNSTGGMFTGAAETAPKENEQPKKSQYASAGFGSSWKKKTATKISFSLSTETASKLDKPDDTKEELPDFLKEPSFDTPEESGEPTGFGWKKKEGEPTNQEEELTRRKGTKDRKRKTDEDTLPDEDLKDKKKKKTSKKVIEAPAWTKRIGEDPDKPLRESAAGMVIEESELRTYNDGNPKPESTAVELSAGDRDDRDWGAWKPRSQRAKPSTPTEERRVREYKEGELSDLHKHLLDPSRFDYDPDFARAGSLQFMHPLQCSKVLGRPYPEDLSQKGQVAFDDDIVAYREPKPIQDPAELGPEPPPDGAIFWGIPEEVETAPRLVILKCGVPENCPGPEPRGWLDGLKRRKWYQKANQPEIRAIHPASYFKRGEQLHQDKTFGVFYHPKYYGKTKAQKAIETKSQEDNIVDDARESLRQSFAT